ncbi:MAG: hypothetical protein KA319_06075 [Ferruginibacter sp.]|nr:hypothetical protein [Ferruginibacter sp.]
MMATIRKKMLDEITSAPESTVKNLYKLYSIVKEQNSSSIKWEHLSDDQKLKIDLGLQQLNQGKGIQANKAMYQLQKKYGLS